MKNPGHAGLVAVLALAALLAACTISGDDLANDEELAADREAAEAMVQAAVDIHAAYMVDIGGADMNSRRPARLVMGTWEYIAKANTDWSQRLVPVMQELEEAMMEDSPEAPWLLIPGWADESGLAFKVFDREKPINCCPLVYMRVQLRNGKLAWSQKGVGYVDYVRPPQEILESVLAREEQYMRDRNTGPS